MPPERSDTHQFVEQAWCSAARAIGAIDNAAIDRAWLILSALYHHPPRAYHNLHHIADCLRVSRQLAAALDHPQRVAIDFALLAHDCVYDSRRHDNETKSADIAALLARDLALPDADVDLIRRLIMATTHKGTPADDPERVIRDIDLSSLAAPPDVFDANTAAIRAEFAWAHDTDFRKGRAAFFRDMLARKSIYFTPLAQSLFEAPARANLERALSILED